MVTNWPNFQANLKTTIQEATVLTKAVQRFLSDVCYAQEWKKKSKQTLTIYSHLAKTMDNHCLASGIASEQQHYLNKSIGIDTTITLDSTIMYAHKNAATKQTKMSP